LPDYLFKDVADVATGRACDLRSQGQKAVPPTDILWMGFSCKDVSHLNNKSKASRTCIRDKSLRTGGTLEKGAQYVESFQPMYVFLENVTALEDIDKFTGTSNAQEVVWLFNRLGYHVFTIALDARQHGSAQRRTRWWGIGVRVSSEPVTPEVEEGYQAKDAEMFAVLQQLELSPVSLDSILLPESSQDLKDWQASRLLSEPHDDRSDEEDVLYEPAGGANKADKANWPELHGQHFRSVGLRYPICLEMLYTTEELRVLRQELSPRSIECVAFHDMLYGRVGKDNREEIIDVSQSINRVPRVIGGAPCTVPRGLQWLRKRFRRVEAVESLAFQGAPAPTFAEVAADFSHAELQSLAGNAFNAHTCMAMLVAAMVVFGPPKADAD